MLSFFYLLCCVSAVKTCLQCDRRIRHLHDNFILSAPSIADQIELKKICDHAYATYKDASLEREGLIDVTTLYRVRTEYESEFDRFLKTPNTGSVTFGAIQIFDKGREILEKHLDKFILEGLCPNKCVSPLPIQTVRSFITLPPLPLEDDFYFGNAETFLVPFLAVVTVLSLTAVVGLTVFMGLMVNKWSDVEELDQSSVFA
ncbi:izumo sperm-egg fusion protein 1 isoform X3 [Takifugu rubripes]|uniref:izumo sperm-egg fusion protein 1 isoform X3 n=1 Tax=Takifugu rubripes TaxID=31033 RepID=UPI001145DBF8|nr:izumo sperm-egg fusion protein 1 isoform X3 [Takifugu rubripes]